MISIASTGSFAKTESFLKRGQNGSFFQVLRGYGQRGVDLLANATPRDSGETASAWSYEIERKRGRYKIIWSNANEVNGVPIAILIQYGHATRHGGYVQGIDFINPALQPLLDEMAETVWKEVTRDA